MLEIKSGGKPELAIERSKNLQEVNLIVLKDPLVKKSRTASIEDLKSSPDGFLFFHNKISPLFQCFLSNTLIQFVRR